MRLAAVLGFTALLGVHTSAAQNATPHETKLRIINLGVQAPMCPINMRVRQDFSAQMTKVKDGAQGNTLAARLKILLSDARAQAPHHQIVQATVTVHGMNGTAQILSADVRPDGRANIAKTLTLRLAGDEGQQVAGDLLLPGFTAVSMVDLETVTYDDGATWKFGGSSACHSAPEFLVPVSGH